MKRRSFMSLAGSGGALLWAPLPLFSVADPVEAASDAGLSTADLMDMVRAKARELAQQPFVKVDTSLPPHLADLNYDDYRRIDFNNHLGIWRDDPSGYELQPLHRGSLQSGRMALNIVEGGKITRLNYNPSLFTFHGLENPEELTADLGYSGVRVLGDVEDDNTAREFLVLQGASYFRALSGGTAYGLSARGLAVRTGNPAGEEFPAFTELWVERAGESSVDLVIHALLDGPSVTGAFTFTVRTGSAPQQVAPRSTHMGVNVVLFPRVDLDHIGLAPLTSMYWYSPLERGGADDFRQRVHDSDGLAICTTDGEWQWRPLSNPKTLKTSSYGASVEGGVHGFGLSQRPREWDDYEDMGANYHMRPSCWIMPHAEWPAGQIELVEIPTDSEYHDNIVAYWRPSGVITAGSEMEVGYDLIWSELPPPALGLLQAISSKSGSNGDGRRQIVIDFAYLAEADQIAAMPSGDLTTLTPLVEGVGARVHGVSFGANPAVSGWRLSFLVEPLREVADLKAVILQHGRAVSETWIYRLATV